MATVADMRPIKYTARLQLVLEEETLKDLDELRRVEPDIPNRSEMARRLLVAGIAARQKPRGAKK